MTIGGAYITIAVCVVLIGVAFYKLAQNRKGKT
jgi:hypothetical protein